MTDFDRAEWSYPLEREFDLKRDCYYDEEEHEWIPCGVSKAAWLARRRDDKWTQPRSACE